MTALGSKCVYVIDDDAEVLNSTAFLLPALGYDCATFGVASEFVERAAELPAGCVLTDLRMPGMDGFELAVALKGQALDWPMIMMTSDDGPALERQALEHGFSSVLRKPVDADLLVDALARAFAAVNS